MSQYPKSILISVLIVACTAFVIELLHRSPPPRVPVPATQAGPGHINYLPSTMDIQRELNRRGYKLKVDGVCGPATQSAWDAECANQYAIEFMEVK